MDKATAVYLLGAWLMQLTNLYALMRDKQARGVRPYLAAYLACGNAWLSYVYFSNGLLWASGMNAVLALTCALTAALIWINLKR